MDQSWRRLGDYSGGPFQGISRHARARQDTKLQLESTDCPLTAWSFAYQVSMVRRGSTVRFHKGALIYLRKFESPEIIGRSRVDSRGTIGHGARCGRVGKPIWCAHPGLSQHRHYLPLVGVPSSPPGVNPSPVRARDAAATSFRATTTSQAIAGLAASPGTDVLPTCSIDTTGTPG